jgi:hypothetical protein
VLLPTTYDSLFDRYGNRVPTAYLRALAKKESNFNPGDTQEPAWGLLQVVEVVRDSYNKRHGGYVPRSALLDPDTNVKMATDLLNRIVVAYGKHPDKNMKEDWSNQEFVKLVTAGWNSGYSEAGGVGKVARYLENQNIPVTHDNVFRYASAAGATRHLSNSAKKSWQRAVTDLYFSQPDAGQTNLGPFLLKVGAATVAGLLLARFVFR